MGDFIFLEESDHAVIRQYIYDISRRLTRLGFERCQWCLTRIS
jgi:hypothetical protein